MRDRTTFKDAIATAESMEYEVRRKDRNRYLRLESASDRIFQLVMTPGGTAARGVRELSVVEVWIDATSKQSSRVALYARAERLEFGPGEPLRVVDSRRDEEVERKVLKELERVISTSSR